jgi:hypothetical protein
MATLRQYFDTDFSRVLSANQPIKYSASDDDVEVIARLHFDFDSNTKFVSYYVPVCRRPVPLYHKLIDDLTWVTAMTDFMGARLGDPGEEPADSSELGFSGRIFIYSETDLSADDLQLLKARGLLQGHRIRFRGPRFALERSRFERPMAFISHDSRDKDEVARPLATRLQQMVCPVWYDEYSLKIGDSLRQSIETGLKECKKCIIVLSPNFLSNTGWTRVEFNSIFTREILERSNLVLPIWHGVSSREVYDYSPSLADRVATDWSLGVDEVSRQIYRAILS